MHNQGKQLCHFCFGRPPQWGPTLNGKNLLPSEQILSFWSRSLFGKTSTCRKANRKSWRSFSFEKNNGEKDGGVCIQLSLFVKKSRLIRISVSYGFWLPQIIRLVRLPDLLPTFTKYLSPCALKFVRDLSTRKCYICPGSILASCIKTQTYSVHFTILLIVGKF